MRCCQETNQPLTAADIAHQHAVEVCERLIAELDKELEKCTTQETIVNP